MQNFERIDLLLQEIGPTSESILEIDRQSETYWEITLVGDVVIEMTYDTAQQKLALSSVVGLPALDDLLTVYRALLQFNSMREETGGVTMSLGEDGFVQQAFELNIAVAEAPYLRAVLENFAEKVLTWRLTLIESPEAEQNPEESAQLPLGVRV